MIISFLISRLFRNVTRLAIVAVLALAAFPANAEYTGGGAIFAPYHCTWPIGVEMTRARYVPGETSGGNSEVTLNFAVGGLNTFSFRSNLAPARYWRRGSGRGVWGALYYMQAQPAVRVLRRTDATYNGGADMNLNDSIRLRLRIRNFNGERGCTVSVALMLHRWD